MKNNYVKNSSNSLEHCYFHTSKHMYLEVSLSRDPVYEELEKPCKLDNKEKCLFGILNITKLLSIYESVDSSV